MSQRSSVISSVWALPAHEVQAASTISNAGCLTGILRSLSGNHPHLAMNIFAVQSSEVNSRESLLAVRRLSE